MNNIILIGPMGCGKTTLGRAAAKSLDMDFVDMDSYIEAKEGLSINEQFARYGEPYFRDRETEAARDAVSMKNTVISTGGGVILRRENMAHLHRAGRVIFIDRPLERILADVDISRRPLLRDGPDQLIGIYNARIGLYRAYADFILQNDKAELTVIKELIALIDTLQNPKFAVIGDPIVHSLSPQVHLAVLGHYVKSPSYERVRVPKGGLPEWLDRVRAEGYQGFNVAMPHKLEIGRYLDDLEMEADLTGSVNCVVNRDGRLTGYSTDALGFFTGLKADGIPYEDKSVLILGAGGAAGALALRAILDGVGRVHMLARRPERARELVLAIRSQHRDCAISWGRMDRDSLADNCTRTDLLINATPQGMEGVADQWESLDFLDALPRHATVCDLIYRPAKTAFLAEAERLGLRYKNGLDMLIYQALVTDHLYLNRDIDYPAMAEVVKSTIREHAITGSHNYG